MHKQNKNFNVEVMKSVDIIQHDQNYSKKLFSSDIFCGEKGQLVALSGFSSHLYPDLMRRSVTKLTSARAAGAGHGAPLWIHKSQTSNMQMLLVSV